MGEGTESDAARNIDTGNDVGCGTYAGDARARPRGRDRLMSNNDSELLRELVEACEEEAASAKWPETKRARAALDEVPGRTDEEQVMPTHSFEIELRWPPGFDQDRVANALYEAGCDDGLFGVYESIPKVDFTRAAPSLGEAVGSAIRDVMRVAGLVVVAVHVEGTG